MTHKVLHVPVAVEEDGKARDEGDDDTSNEAVPSREGLERSLPRERVAVDTLDLAALVEPDKGEAERRPGDQARDGREVLQPRERLRGAATAEREVREGTKEEGGDDGVVRGAVLVGDAEEGRQLTVGGHGHDHARADPAVAVTGGPRRDQDAGL